MGNMTMATTTKDGDVDERVDVDAAHSGDSHPRTAVESEVPYERQLTGRIIDGTNILCFCFWYLFLKI